MSGMSLIFIGLTLSSSWGNGHAMTYRALLRALAARGHAILFLERETPWYSANRDLTAPDFCELRFYDTLEELDRYAARAAAADAVIVGSFTPQGVAVGEWARREAGGVLAFYDIDTPVTLANLAGGQNDYLSERQIPDYDVYFSFTGGPVLERLSREFGAPAARALYCTADPERYAPKRVEQRWDLSYLGTYSADRQPVLERLLLSPARRAPHLKFCVAGPQYPADIDWPANVERLEHAPPDTHAEFYSASRFTLNATRADMIAAGHSPSVRLFEAAACATPVISDVWRGVEEHFTPGLEILLAHTSSDVLRALSLPDQEARSIGNRARERFLKDHLPDRRAEAFETAILEAQVSSMATESFREAKAEQQAGMR